MAELVDAHGSGPCAARCGGSSPLSGTKYKSARASGPFLFVPGKAKHASRQDSKGIRCTRKEYAVVVKPLKRQQPRSSGCRGRACVTEPLPKRKNKKRSAERAPRIGVVPSPTYSSPIWSWNYSNGWRNTIVSSRSGPVETISIGTPHTAAMRSR
jgi:hypothetical protein